MLPKSRMVAALEHREPDRIPIGEHGVCRDIVNRALGVKSLFHDKWRQQTTLWSGLRDEVVDSQVEELVGVVKRFEWDFVVPRMVPPRRDSYSKPEILDEYVWRDHMGRVWHYSPETEGRAMAFEFPPLTIDDLPDPEAPVALEDSEFEAIERVVEALGETHMVLAMVPDGTFPWEDTIGMAAYLERMIAEPEFVRKATAVACKRSIATIKAMAALGVDGVYMTTDYCDNHGPLMGPRLFREFVLPALSACVTAAHEEGLYFVKHSDGNQWSILDDFVAAKVDGWQGIQPRIGMDFKLLKEKYGDKLTLFGGVNCETLTLGGPADVEEEVKYAIRHAARGGGLVITSGNTLMPHTKNENYIAMLSAIRRYGSYPIGEF